MTSIADIQAKSSKVVQSSDQFVQKRIDADAFTSAIEELYNAVRGLNTGVEVGATADKLFRQSNLLQQSGKELVTAVSTGGSAEPFLTRVKNGAKNVEKTATQLLEEGQ